jgi:hypothetical protein
MSFLSKLFGRKTQQEASFDPQQEEAELAWDKEKSAFMEAVLGQEHDMVMHAIIPFAVGGGLDLYYYPNGAPGTGIATKELVDRRGKGPSNRVFPCYELVMFTKHTLNLDEAKNPETPFGAAHTKINSVLNLIANYCAQAKLNPNETCEFPAEMEKVGGKCLIFDAYPSAKTTGPKGMGLLLVMEVHRSEMEFARQNGGEKLIEKLKESGVYPYSDMERDPVA